MVNAVVLAGPLDRRLAGPYEVPSKALIPVAGKPCVQYVLESLRATPGVGGIALAGLPAVLDDPAAELADSRIADEGTIVSKLSAAAEAFGEGRKLLMVTCDIPLATPQSFADTIAACPEDCAFFHPLVAKEDAVRDFPDHKWFFLRLREAQVVTTNVLVFDPAWLRARSDLARSLEALRRHPNLMALRWGLPFLLRYELGLLTLDYCERFFSKILKAPCRGAIGPYVALAVDLDRPEDVPILERALRRGEEPSDGR